MPDMFSPCFELENSKYHPFNHLPLKSNPYMTPDTAVCREEWARLLANIRPPNISNRQINQISPSSQEHLDAPEYF